MREPDERRLFPAFLLDDPNGAALIRAIMAGCTRFLASVADALDTLKDPDKMPEWRLDEMAWETGCVYDYRGSLENKRTWLKNAFPNAGSLGTADAVTRFLQGYFEYATLEEAADYGGNPFHFRVVVGNALLPSSHLWMEDAIAKCKNVRSVWDYGGMGASERVHVTGQREQYPFPFPVAGDEGQTGQYPDTAQLGAVRRESTGIETDAGIVPVTVEYLPCGTMNAWEEE